MSQPTLVLCVVIGLACVLAIGLGFTTLVFFCVICAGWIRGTRFRPPADTNSVDPQAMIPLNTIELHGRRTIITKANDKKRNEQNKSLDGKTDAMNTTAVVFDEHSNITFTRQWYGRRGNSPNPNVCFA